MNLKNTLGQIEAYGGNLHGGWLLCLGCLTANPLWHSDAGSGSHPPHLKEGNAIIASDIDDDEVEALLLRPRYQAGKISQTRFNKFRPLNDRTKGKPLFR